MKARVRMQAYSNGVPKQKMAVDINLVNPLQLCKKVE